jgi:hypothetical protein
VVAPAAVLPPGCSSTSAAAAAAVLVNFDVLLRTVLLREVVRDAGRLDVARAELRVVDRRQGMFQLQRFFTVSVERVFRVRDGEKM